MSLSKFHKLLDKKLESVPEWMELSLASIPKEWHGILFGKEQRKKLIKIFDKLEEMKKPKKELSPSPDNIFEFARLTPMSKITTVILGQDPYPNPDHAHGLAFSSLDKKIPSSLRNIYKCLVKHEFIEKMPKTADLSTWAARGVLLLNCSLTTKVGSSNVHKSEWNPYTDIVLEKLSEKFSKQNKTLIFMLWGKDAQEKASLIKNHIILKWRHPSPLAQNCDDRHKFINCTHFKDANEVLSDEKEFKLGPIDWNPRKKVIEIYTDGSAFPNKNEPAAKNGYACMFTKGCLENLVIYGSTPKHVMHPTKNTKMCSTSQRAEGMAILKAIAKCNTVSVNQWDEVQIVTDSLFWCKMIMSYMPYWKNNNTDFNEKENPDITTEMWKELGELRIKGKFNIRHISSHGKNGLKDAKKNTKKWYDYQNNKTADMLANMARKELEYDTCVEDTDILE